MGAEGAAVATSASVQKVEPLKSTPPARAERREQLIQTMKADAKAQASGDTQTAPVAKEAPTTGEQPAERKAEPFSEVARQHKRVLEKEKALEKERAELAEIRKDAEIAKAIRQGDWSKAKELGGDDWYEKATQHTIGQMKPKAPEVIEQRLTEKIAKLEQQLEEVKNPKPIEPSEEQITAGVNGLKSQAMEAMRGDERFSALQKEAAQSEEAAKEVSDEIYAFLDRQFAVTKKMPTKEDMLDACVKLEAALRAQNELTGKGDDEKTSSADTEKRVHQAQQARSESGGGSSKTTLTASLHQSVPVKGKPSSKEERRAAAKAMLRAARETDE